MFFVLNKQKIYAYGVSIITVIMLFLMANVIVNQNAVQTGASVKKELPIYQVKTEEKKVAFTMNCAWSAEDINSILETLNKNDTKITFFLVGDWIDKNPEAVEKISNAGHEIGSHSNTHPHVNNLTKEENIKEMEECNKKIEKITGKRTNLYRTPYGEYNDLVIQTAKEQKYVTIQWNLDTLDYKDLTGEQMWNRIKNKLENGSIILSHNGTKYTASSLDFLIKNIQEKGFQIVTVSELIYQENYTIDNNGVQIRNYV